MLLNVFFAIVIISIVFLALVIIYRVLKKARAQDKAADEQFNTFLARLPQKTQSNYKQIRLLREIMGGILIVSILMFIYGGITNIFTFVKVGFMIMPIVFGLSIILDGTGKIILAQAAHASLKKGYLRIIIGILFVLGEIYSINQVFMIK